MTKKLLALAAAVVLVGVLASLGSSVLAANPGPRALITQPVDNRQTVTLYGNTRPEATANHNRGRVADTFPLNHMLLQLKRAPEVESAFEAYIDSLTDKTSPNFRHWIIAAEQGDKFGVAQQDIDAITAWLVSQGFTVGHVYPNHGRKLVSARIRRNTRLGHGHRPRQRQCLQSGHEQRLVVAGPALCTLPQDSVTCPAA